MTPNIEPPYGTGSASSRSVPFRGAPPGDADPRRRARGTLRRRRVRGGAGADADPPVARRAGDAPGAGRAGRGSAGGAGLDRIASPDAAGGGDRSGPSTGPGRPARHGPGRTPRAEREIHFGRVDADAACAGRVEMRSAFAVDAGAEPFGRAGVGRNWSGRSARFDAWAHVVAAARSEGGG